MVVVILMSKTDSSEVIFEEQELLFLSREQADSIPFRNLTHSFESDSNSNVNSCWDAILSNSENEFDSVD